MSTYEMGIVGLGRMGGGLALQAPEKGADEHVRRERQLGRVGDIYRPRAPLSRMRPR